jgi:serine/threonine-protein kinase RsbW
MQERALPRCEFDAGKLILRVEMVVAAEVSGIDAVVDRLMDIIKEMSCATGKEFEIETSLREALVNAIVHGCQGDPNKQVQICVACDESRGVIILVRDPGPGFDPASIPSPIVGQNLYSAHGRGIYLISELMDDVQFARGGTEIIMRKG